MPCIRITTSQAIDSTKREALEHALGKAIEIFPGKSEAWLMLVFQDQTPVCFAGDDTLAAAFVEVSILGNASGNTFEKMTARICDILESILQIPQNRIYVKYEECTHWGWNGGNF